MQITSAKFIKGIVGPDEILDNDTPQIAFIGRSNAGKSTLLNSLTGKKKLAIASKTPGRTKEINVFLVNNSHYFLDLPGYGYAKASNEAREKLSELIFWYLLDCEYEQRVVLLIDAIIGPTADDLTVLGELEKAGRDIVVIANKADKIKKSSFKQHIDKLQQQIRGHRLIPYSSTAKIGIQELTNELLGVGADGA